MFAIAVATRVKKSLIVQRMYREHLAYLRYLRLLALLLKIKQRMSIRLITKSYAKYQLRQYVESRKTIPPLPLEIWDIIFGYMDRMFSVPHRRLATDFSCRYPSRLPGPTCGICRKQAFIPVCLRFGWNGLSLGVKGDELLFSRHTGFPMQKDSEFCSHPNNMYCLRCARDHIKLSDGTGRLVCPHGCCFATKPFYYKPFMAYGDWPRGAAAPAHQQLYSHMDKQGVGSTRCPLCSIDCVTTLAALNHIRTVCRRSH